MQEHISNPSPRPLRLSPLCMQSGSHFLLSFESSTFKSTEQPFYHLKTNSLFLLWKFPSIFLSFKDKNKLQHIQNSTACPQPSPWPHNLRNLYPHHVIKLIQFQDLLLLAHLYFDNEAPSHPSDLCQTSTPLMPTFCLCHPRSSAWSWGGRALFVAPTSIWNIVPKPRLSESTSFKLARKCIY